MSETRQLPRIRRIVCKVGSSLLTNSSDLSLNIGFIEALVTQIKQVRDSGVEVILVTSGGVAAGLPLLGWKERPATFTDLHVAAAAGQVTLFGAYDKALTRLDIRSAQVLLTAEELADRKSHLNARLTLNRLLELGLLPIANENDAVAIHERRYGNNDQLGAELANLLDAQLLVILSDVEGIYTDGPSGGQVLAEAAASQPGLRELASDDVRSSYGSGGMTSKIDAAIVAANGGVSTVIASGRTEHIVRRVLAGDKLGTLLRATESKLRSKKRWLASCASPSGALILDDGAVAALTRHGRSLLPVGVALVEGAFERGDVVNCIAASKDLVARGIVNYSSQDVAQLARQQSSRIQSILGYSYAEEVIHRDNLVTIDSGAAAD